MDCVGRSGSVTHSATILANILGPVLQNFLYLEAFESDTTFDSLNYTV